MSSPAPIVSDVRRVIAQLEEIKQRYRKSDDDERYEEWCEGIVEAAIAALNVIAGE